jgi:hypothetical protein
MKDISNISLQPAGDTAWDPHELQPCGLCPGILSTDVTNTIFWMNKGNWDM